MKTEGNGAIKRFIQSSPPTLANGLAGLALAAHGRGHKNATHAYTKKFIALKDSYLASPSLMTGLPGILFSMKLTGMDQEFRKENRSFKAHLAKTIPTYLSRLGRYELMCGAAGLGVYARFCQDDFILRCVLDYLLVSLEKSSIGLIWRPYRDPAMILEDNQVTTANINYGLSHGFPGPIALLSLIARERDDDISEFAGALLRKVRPSINNFIKAVGNRRARPKQEPRLNFGEQKIMTTWCYGDPGVGYALSLMGDAITDKSIKTWGDSRIKRGVSLRRRTSVSDTGGVCHGPAAQSLLSKMAEKQLGIPSLPADAWLEIEKKRGLGHGLENIESSKLHPGTVGILGLSGVDLLMTEHQRDFDLPWAAAFLLR